MEQLNCQKCGACCSNPYDKKWIEVTKEDAIRINDNSLLQTGDIEIFAMKQNEQGRCINLIGDIGGDLKCTIYDKRPNICRIVQPHDNICNKLRQIHNL